MKRASYSRPLPLTDVQITDAFWQREMELVRREVIPYQWEALNDRVPGAEKSYCMHNFRAAARLMAQRRLEGTGIRAKYTMNGFQQLPDDPAHPDPDHFYGFVFQDTDFSKWIEAVGYSLTLHPDAQLERTADEAIDVVCAAQAEDGYLDTCYILGGMDRRFTNLRDHHELYCLGHLIEGAVAYYQATGKDKLLRSACRFADCVAERFGPGEGQCHGYPGHEIAEMALVRLYEVTGEERYLTLSRYFIDERGREPKYFVQEAERRQREAGPDERISPTDLAYHQTQSPVREQSEATGHAVRAMYLYAGMADVARVTGDESLTAACRRLWNSAVNQKMYITGGVGSTRLGEAFSYPYDLPSDTAYSETCAAIGLVFFARRMLQLRADRCYGDIMELALYNTVLAGMALDGRSFFYVNPLEVVPEAAHQDRRLEHVKTVRQKWFGCACCPPNLARLVSSLGAYVCTATEDTLYTHLYVSGSVKATLNGQPLTLHMTSRMPWQGDAAARVETAGATGTLAFRLPGWCDMPSVRCEGKRVVVRDGYAYLTGAWHGGEEIALHFPMRVRLMTADPRVRETAGQLAVTRGPIVFCGEEKDNGDGLHMIRLHPEEIRVKGVVENRSDVFGHETLALEVPAWRVAERSAGLYQEWTPACETPFTLRLIPYYCWANRGEGEMRVWWRT